jgi:hypothetical protein
MRVKAEIEDDEGLSTVEFSVEEMIGRNPGLGWGELDEEARIHALEDYAASLYGRQAGRAGHPQVRIDRSTLPR